MNHQTAHRDEQVRREKVDALHRQQAARERRRRQLVLVAWAVGLVTVVGVVAAMMAGSQPASSTTSRTAPGFTLADTSGATVDLADFGGSNVLLYFNEGAGCQSCLVQMAEIEKHADHLTELDVTVLSIVMNTREQITADMAASGVRTPFLLDDGTVSDAYATLGKGMHAGLPGHSFVLVDGAGTQRWYAEYPQLSPEDLLAELRNRLGA